MPALVRKKGQEVFQGFKVDLESDDEARRKQARELTEEFFAFLYKEYASQSEGGHLGSYGDGERTIVSYPVKWSDESKRFMLEAAKKAGFKNVEGMDEAQAAISAVTVQSEDILISKGLFRAGAPSNILLIDMGAGTTDLALCRYTPGANAQNQVLSVWPRKGEILFGGREADELLRSYILTVVDEEEKDRLRRITDEQFKSWKENVVSPALAENDLIDEFYALDEAEIEYDSFELTKAVFNDAASEYLEQFPKLIGDCVADAGIKPEDVDLVILTGGHSQWYFAEELLKDGKSVTLPKIRNDPNRIVRISRPQETVALGMVYSPLSKALQSSLKSEEKPEPQPQPKPAPKSEPKPKPAPDPSPEPQTEIKKNVAKVVLQTGTNFMREYNFHFYFDGSYYASISSGRTVTTYLSYGTHKVSVKVFRKDNNQFVGSSSEVTIDTPRIKQISAYKGFGSFVEINLNA